MGLHSAAQIPCAMSNLVARSAPFTSCVPSTNEEICIAEDIPRVLPSLLPQWTSSNISVKRVTGGITNTIFKAEHQSGTPSSVLVRIFGGQDVFTREDRQRETEIFEQLGIAGIAPKLLAAFGNGRVEKWLDARTISLDEMTSDTVCIGVAKAMARMHGFEPIGEARKVELWSVVEGWAKEAVGLAAEGRFQSIDVDHCVKCLRTVKERLLRLESPVVFSHNDLLFGNIMVSSGAEQSVSLVDFEYSSYNYRGFDIGNFFCEAMGGTIDGHVDGTRYPSIDYRTQFCRTYLYASGTEPSDEDVAALVDEAERYGLAAHLYWGFWALVQSFGSAVDFPYVTFAEQRFAEFFKRFRER